jgi:hypothetical protein
MFESPKPPSVSVNSEITPPIRFPVAVRRRAHAAAAVTEPCSARPRHAMPRQVARQEKRPEVKNQSKPNQAAKAASEQQRAAESDRPPAHMRAREFLLVRARAPRTAAASPRPPTCARRALARAVTVTASTGNPLVRAPAPHGSRHRTPPPALPTHTPGRSSRI